MKPAEFVSTFWTYSVQSIEALLLPPVFIALVITLVGLVVSYRKQRPFGNPLWKPSYWLVLTQLAFFPLSIMTGVLYTGDATIRSPNLRGVAICKVLDWLSILLALFCIYRMKGLRWFAFSLVVVLELILQGAFFISGMATSGDWI